MFGPRHKNTSRRRRSGDFYAEADRISLRRTFSQVKQPIHAHLLMVRSDSKWLPRYESPREHNSPCRPCGGGNTYKTKIGTVTAPVKKKCAAIPETMKSRYCSTVLSGGCNQAAGGGKVGKVLMRQCVPEHGRAALSLMVKAASRCHSIRRCRLSVFSIANRRIAVDGCQWLVHRHTLTAYRR